jgi:hypothetical protein
MTQNEYNSIFRSTGTIVVNKNGIEVQMFVDSGFNLNNQAVLRLVALNNNPVPIDDFHFQAAVTKVYFFSITTTYSFSNFKLNYYPPSLHV